MSRKDKAKQLLKAVLPSPIRKGCRGILSATRSILLVPRTTTSLIGQSQNLRKQYPSIKSVEQLAGNHTPKQVGETKTLDLGCGANIRNPFGAKETFGVDIRSDLSQNIKQADLSAEAIPFNSNFFDFCTAFDVIEHIPRNSWANGKGRLAFLELMNEIHRVLKPGGLFLHSTPAFPSKQAFQDPTHVNIITEDTIPLYFCEPNNLAKGLGYGFHGSFELVEQRWVSNIWLAGILKAIK
jgi:SAM-dependent methyltransferase